MDPELAERYGRGIAFPARMGALGLVQSAGAQKVEESIRMILGTQYGERVMRPRFGCNLKSLAFAPNNAATADLARYYVEEGLTLWEPRIELVDVVVTNDNAAATLVVEVSYRLRATQELQTLVHRVALEPPR
jgi:phage baseplate assembly protein W